MKSIFFRRLLLVMVAVMLFSSISMSVAYGVFSNDLYVNMKLEEMLPKVEAITQLEEEHRNREISDAAFVRMAEAYMKTIGAVSVIADSAGNVQYMKDLTYGVSEDAVSGVVSLYAGRLVAGETVRASGVYVEGIGYTIVVGMPMQDGTGNVIGSVLVLKDIKEITDSIRPMRLMMYSFVAASFALIIVILSWSVSRTTSPLHDMSEAAIKISKGNFEIRMNETQAGEIGVLARALNKLCETLSSTIYQLRFEKSQLDQVLQGLTDGVAAMDGTGELTHCNSALLRMFGVVNVTRREDIISDGMVWRTFDEVFDDGAPQTITYPLPGDKTIWITISPVVTDDGIRTGVVGLFKDMTEMERLENTRREYVANVSHELRTPLTAVRGLLEPLADGMVQQEEDRMRYYKIMLHEVERLSRLISDMLILSRLQSGTEYMEASRVNLCELLDDLVNSYIRAAEQKGIHLVKDCRTAVVDALTDPDRIEQVLVILLDNAMRYTPEGGTITLRLRSGEKFLISVEDNGCGIPEKDLPHIFERFYKVDKSRGEGGTGLGLSIAKYIMDKLGEEISVDSELGRGTLFTLTVKRYVSNAIELGPARESVHAAGAKNIPVRDEAQEDHGGVVDADYEIVPGSAEPMASKPPKPVKSADKHSGKRKKWKR